MGLSFQAEGLFPRKGIDMWIRGTVRRIVVALLGIQITIIALATAASATSHPSGGAPSSPVARVETFDDVPHWYPEAFSRPWAHPRRAVIEAALAEAYEMGPRMVWPGFSREDYVRFVLAHERHEWDGRDWRPAHVWTSAVQEDSDITVAEQPQTPVRRPEAATEPVRTGTATLTRKAAHRRAQPDLARVMPRQAAMQLTNATATRWLKSSGLHTTSSGNCTSKHLHHCTSLDSVRTGTIARVIELKRVSHCPIMVTGGTEAGHAPGHYSHGNGYKLDITHNSCIDRYITKHHHKDGIRSDGAALYRSGSGITFADESSHWDILFR
jgi:hypothetical protein